jgi:Fe-S-cluster containining protein
MPDDPTQSPETRTPPPMRSAALSPAAAPPPAAAQSPAAAPDSARKPITQATCVDCGACCFLGWDVLLSPGEVDYFDRRPRLKRLTVIHRLSNGMELRFLKKGADDRCICLEGELGRVCCSIYQERPGLCREFEPGSEDCLEARRTMGLDA